MLIKQSVQRVHAQAPKPPAHFVPRPEVTDGLKKQLLDGTSSLVISAIHGLGGIGKSTLAALLAHDPEIKAHFTDGVLWVTLGQDPNLLALLTDWIQAVGDYDFKPTTSEIASNHLHTLLSESCMLLVIDDAWQASHARLFKVGGRRCRVLITTRQSIIATVLEATLYNLDVMSPEQSVAVIERRLMRSLKEPEKTKAQALAQALGYLPLALELTASQLVDGVSWSELLASLHTEVARLRTFDVPGIEDETDDRVIRKLSLRACFTLSLRILSLEDLARFAWLGVLPEDVSLIFSMMNTVWDLDTNQAQRLLRTLKSKALLLAGAPLADGTPTYRQHDLLHDIARHLLTSPTAPQNPHDLPGLQLTISQAHTVLLERYKAQTLSEQWHTLPFDGYIQEHLTWHMEQAKQYEQMRALLHEQTAEGQNAWYSVKETLGQTASFVNDVSRIWAVARNEMRLAAKPEAMTDVIITEIRCALILSSLNSIDAQLPSILLKQLVISGVWTPAQALAHSLRIPDNVERIVAQAAVVSFLPLEVGLRIVQDLWFAASHISQNSRRKKALSALAYCTAKVGLYDEAINAVNQLLSTDCQPMTDGIMLLPSPLKENTAGALAFRSMKIADEVRRIKALASLLPMLSKEQHETVLSEAIRVANNIFLPVEKAKALLAIAAHVPDAVALDIAHIVPGLIKQVMHETTRAGLIAHSAERVHRFRRKERTDSTRMRAAIPEQNAHKFVLA